MGTAEKTGPDFQPRTTYIKFRDEFLVAGWKEAILPIKQASGF